MFFDLGIIFCAFLTLTPIVINLFGDYIDDLWDKVRVYIRDWNDRYEASERVAWEQVALKRVRNFDRWILYFFSNIDEE